MVVCHIICVLCVCHIGLYVYMCMSHVFYIIICLWLVTVGSIIMAVDKTNKFLVTADVDGQIKSWLIDDYNLVEQESGKPNNTPPCK